MRIAQLVERLGQRRQGLVTARELCRAGVSAQALGRAVGAGQVVRVRRGVYAREPLAPLPPHLVTASGVAPEWVRQVRAELLSLGGTATAAGRTAATLIGWPLLVEPVSVEVVVQHGRSGTTPGGVRVVQRRAAGRSRLTVAAGDEQLPLTSPMQTVLDCGRSLPFREAVVLCDSALRSGLVTLPDLERAAAPLHGLSGAGQLRSVLAAADPRSESVLETAFRLTMLAGDVSGFHTQVAVRDAAGCPVLRTDFCFGVQGLVVEVDGAAWHQDAARDRSRDNLLAAAGWRVLRFTWADVMYDGDRTLSVLKAALSGTSPATGRLAA